MVQCKLGSLSRCASSDVMNQTAQVRLTILESSSQGALLCQAYHIELGFTYCDVSSAPRIYRYTVHTRWCQHRNKLPRGMGRTSQAAQYSKSNYWYMLNIAATKWAPLHTLTIQTSAPFKQLCFVVAHAGTCGRTTATDEARLGPGHTSKPIVRLFGRRLCSRPYPS